MKRLRTPASPALFQRDDVVRWDIGCAERSVGSRLTLSSVMTGTNAPTENITSLRRRLFAHSRCSTLVNSVLVDRKSTRLNSSHSQISYAVFCLKKKRRAH